MKKVMSDEDLNRALEPKIEEDRVRKAQEKARNQINYERYIEREEKLYEREYKKMKRSARRSTVLPLLIFILVILIFIYILTYYPWLLGV